jgi:chlorobactene glucosyltransferase
MRRTLTHATAVVGFFYALRSLRLLRGWIRVPAVDALDDAPALSVIVPARNEERNIDACVRSLVAQHGLACEVIVVDDRSTDGTRGILTALQAEFTNLRVIEGQPLPDGWVGKPWACAQGAARAQGEWLLFTDADSRHEPHASISTIAFARANGADAVTIMTGQDMLTLGERAALPAILGLVVFATGTLEAVNDPRRTDRALANGQYILIARDAYEALGGHTAVRGEMVEDIEFARHVKIDGRFRLLVAEGTQLVHVRMYRSLRELWDGFTKNMYLAARGNYAALAGGTLFCASLSVLPPLLALASARRREWARVAEALAVTGVVIATAARGAPYVSMPRRIALYTPFGIALFGAIALNSTRRALTGQGFEWRGRRYAAGQSGRLSFGVGESRERPG